MSTAIINSYRDLLRQHAEAEKRVVELKAEIQLHEKQMELAAIAGRCTVGSQLAGHLAFIEEYREELTPNDQGRFALEDQESKGVSGHSEISGSLLSRTVDTGKLGKRKSDALAVTPAAVAEMLSVKVEHVYQLITSKQLKASNISTGKKAVWRIQVSEVESFLARRQTKGSSVRRRSTQSSSIPEYV
ncbi:Helix-turn-helix domain-containing protein [Neorhodopirellula lusitana]|uniref:Helix-turn-helix domain-containing protein n=1 Tax=Neorhodopirellula lusitana TaxID=445327 RepID=A0ABY1PQC8_9BACT|nr:helix-turn-helix domain-containing protein [Neorhodopirellula lusitana]SMP41601.1 Helix-turn-helix domain-containing protein [Neorhodopirellula lusitana]